VTVRDPSGIDGRDGQGIVDMTAARTMLGFRPIFLTVYTARAAGAL
jgi:hypothetical protein